MQGRGHFITLEGSEGVGKSTQMAVVCEELRAAGLGFDTTREPGGTPLSESIRGLLLDPANQAMGQDCELLLMFAARAQHLSQRIRPALESGRWVVCDRFTDSSFAYQGGGRGVPLERIETLARWTHADLQPDLTLLLDTDPESVADRVGRQGGKDRFETEAMAFFQRVRQVFLDRARAEPQRIRVIDAGGSMEAVAERVRAVVRDYLGNSTDSTGSLKAPTTGRHSQ